MTQYEDNYLWLEEVEGSKALDFVRAENEKTLAHFKAHPDFKKIEPEVRKITFAKDRIPMLNIENGELYNFWQDEKHVRGLWRKTSVASYKTGKPQWDVIIDLDKLAQQENENWVWRGADFLRPEGDRVLLSLSRGGKDASVIREFDLKTRQFVKDGFNVPESKGYGEWMDRDTIYVGTDFGPGSMTESGYPRIVKRWKRGTPLAEAVEILAVKSTDMSVYVGVDRNAQGTHTIFIRKINFYEQEIFYLEKDGTLTPSPFPSTTEISGLVGDEVFFQFKKDFGSFKTGTVVALKLKDFGKGPAALKNLEVVFEPTEKRFLEWGMSSKNTLFFTGIDNVVAKVFKFDRNAAGKWQTTEISLGASGMTSVQSVDKRSDQMILIYTDFLTPTSMYLVDGAAKTIQPQLLDTAPKQFQADDLRVERYEAQSADGTMIPYFVVSKKNMKKDGTNPTLLYGYGGFEYALPPSYLGATGKVWLERGGVYVLANLRGGGEFGPNWHQSVLKENRYKVYQDFIAIAEKLIADKITSPAHLGIKGGSNGGLLVGATAMLRPDLFNAVLCQVPLLDMLRYHKLLAGASWMAEYGDPDNFEMREHILKYSPYQKVTKDGKYPEIFFMTSTKDDRVHPGHARKMFAKMKDMGHKVYYYENIEGGHGGVANLEQGILWKSLEFTYLWERLATPNATKR